MEDYTYLKLTFDEKVHETEMAYLLSFDGDEIWIPESLVGDINEDEHEVWVADWFVNKEGLDPFIDEED